ncbi:MAG TPA: cyclopropane fatty acyl phospholipid synthase [Opitutales bacterium]|jgi:cyclopropane-fatty-acyl-phospholipid synthase|nr:cyclopropane fatty acyl phospholipid synthase [Opitutales bacterium]
MNTCDTPTFRGFSSAMAQPRRSHAEAVVTDVFARANIHMDGAQPWDLRIHNRHFYSRVLRGGSLAMGESYMEGWWDCDDFSEMFFRAISAKLDQQTPINLRTILAWGAAFLFNPQSKNRSRVVGLRHYDLGNDFFGAMLGPTWQYSCAYFKGTDDVDEAQRLKIDLICRKLGLRKGMRLLDIGCGWGGLANHAARHYGCEVVGITISKEQQAFAQNLCRDLPVYIRLQDYRELAEPFDRVVSVGMMEHVGSKNYRTYMRTAHQCLKPGGLFLCHTIGDTISHVRPDPWIATYIFPNSQLPSAAQVAHAAEGLFVLEDVHNFGACYDRTLLAWEKNFTRAWPQFRDRYGERFQRMWRYYLLGCAAAFRARSIELFQFVWSKDGVPGGYDAPR